jgi:hypothetical protein
MLKLIILDIDWSFIKDLLCKENVKMSKTVKVCQKSIYNILWKSRKNVERLKYNIDNNEICII